jgi:predicted transcriptional regulator
MKNELREDTAKAKKKYFERKCEEIVKFQRMLLFNTLDYKRSRFEIISWDSNHWRRKLSGNIIADLR